MNVDFLVGGVISPGFLDLWDIRVLLMYVAVALAALKLTVRIGYKTAVIYSSRGWSWPSPQFKLVGAKDLTS